MKIYIASHCHFKARMLASILSREGHTITARWVGKEFWATEGCSEIERSEIAQEDYDDVMRSDALVLTSCDEKVSGGKFVEVGIALGAGTPVYVIGHRENMLMWHPAIKTLTYANELAL